MGDTIYYMSNATADGHTHIFKMDINGVTSTQITHNEDIINGGTLGNKLGSGNFRPQGLAISPDETRIAWSLPMNNDGVADGGYNGAELYVYYIEGKTLTDQAGTPTYQMDAGTHYWVASEPTPWSAVAHKDHGNPIWIDDNTIGWTRYNQDGGASSRPIFHMRYAHEDWPNPASDYSPWNTMTASINHGNSLWPIYSTGFRLLDVGGGASGYSYTIVMRDSGDALGDIINMGLGDDREEYRGTVLSVMSTGADTFDKSKDDEAGMHNQSQDLTQRIEKAPNHWTSDNNAKLSPDNSEIVFDSLHRAGLDTREIYKMPFTAIVPPWNGGSVAPAAGWPTLTQLTNCDTGALSGFAKAHSPQWMSNGRILFYAETSGNDKWSGDIFTMAGDGTDIQNISTFSNKSIPPPTHWPNRTSFNGTGCHWPAGHVHADYFDYRDWTGSMGLDGAGSQESLSKEDCWDTF